MPDKKRTLALCALELLMMLFCASMPKYFYWALLSEQRMSLYATCQPELEPFDYALGGQPQDVYSDGTAMLAGVQSCPPPAPLSARLQAQPDFIVNLTLEQPPDGGIIEYVAAAPPDYRTSFGGSALPFGSPRQAFEGSPSRGTARVAAYGGRQLQLQLQFPNSFYTGLGSKLVPPTLFVRYKFGGRVIKAAIKLSNGIPYRSLAHPPLRHSAEFYGNIAHLPVRTQEGVLRDSAYPTNNAEASDFWGLKPAV